jgi:hypothetical protein
MSWPVWLVLAATPAPLPFDKSKVQPGWTGFIFFVVMGAAVVLLWRSMRKQLGRIDVTRHQRQRRAAAPPPLPPPTPPAGEGSAQG